MSLPPSNRSVDSKQVSMLQQHFNLFYKIAADTKVISNSNFDVVNGMNRCLSGISSPYCNILLGIPSSQCNLDKCIIDQLDYFKSNHMPFVWCVEEPTDPEFKDKLDFLGFKDIGVFQGVIGSLDAAAIKIPGVPENYVLELTQDELTLNAFNDLVCETFGMQNCKSAYKKVMLNASQGNNPLAFHWVAKKDEKVVSAITTLIKDNIVSFWNGASDPSIRRQGINTALRCLALKHAISNGCKFGTSYLMSDGLALGICKKLGYQIKWRLQVFMAPSNKRNGNDCF